VKLYGVNRDLLPPKKMSGNLSKQLIDKRRQLLERYLQKLVHNVLEIARSPELQMFLDVPTHVSLPSVRWAQFPAIVGVWHWYCYSIK